MVSQWLIYVRLKLPPIHVIDGVLNCEIMPIYFPYTFDKQSHYFLLRCLFTVTLVVVTYGGVFSEEVFVNQEVRSHTEPADKLALLVGINDYRPNGLLPLDGCLNDVALLKGVLQTKFGFEPCDIITLVDAEATREAILEQFRVHLLEKARPGTTLVFYFSGHGSLIRDEGGEEPDGLDETLVAYDSRQPGSTDITDDEIRKALQALGKTDAQVTLIVDACHSGTLTREWEQVRFAPPDQREKVCLRGDQVSSAHLYQKGSLRDPGVNCALVSACASHEKAVEFKIEDREHGLFTWYLCQVLSHVSGEVTYRDVWDDLRGAMASQFLYQHPQLEGAKMDHHIFGGPEILPEKYLYVSPEEGARILIQGGRIHGVTVGSEFNVFPPRTKRFLEEDESIGTIRVDSVGDQVSWARASRPLGLASNSRAVEVRHRFGERKLKLRLGGDWNSYAAFRTWLACRPYLNLVEKTSGDLVLVSEGEGFKMFLSGEEKQPVSIWYSMPNLGEMELHLLFWQRWFRVLNLENPNSSLRVRFTISPYVPQPQRSQGLEAEGEIKAGTSFSLVVDNAEAQDMYIHILDLNTNGEISVIFPVKGEGQEIVRGGHRWSKAVTATLSEGRSSTMDVIVAVVSSNPDLDLSYLEGKAGVTRSRGEGLENALSQNKVGGGAIHLADWNLKKRVLKIFP